MFSAQRRYGTACLKCGAARPAQRSPVVVAWDPVAQAHRRVTS